MHASLQIVAILTIGFTLASFFAYVMQLFRLPAILGYLIAGYLIGPYSPGFVADTKIAEQLAEVGVILMLFGVGLHLKFEDLFRVKDIVIPGAIIQTVAAAVFAMIIVSMMGWTVESGLIMGLSIGVASTVVLVRMLNENNLLHTPQGHIAVGWLVVEDIFTVLILILLPTIAAFSSGETFSFATISGSILFILAKFCILALFMFTWGQKIVQIILTSIARLRSQELFTLTIIALVFLIAVGSTALFGTSIALGAFLAGMVIGKTNVKHQAAANALPLKDIFAVLFFISVGMLFNPTAIATHFALFMGIIFIILVIKPVFAYLATILLGYSQLVAITVAISLAQIGEFSFILAEQAMNLNILPEEGFDILVACAIVSISLNPLFFRLIEPLTTFFQKFSKHAKKSPILDEIEHDTSKVVIVGFGATGKEVAKIARSSGYVPIIIEQNIDTVSKMKDHLTILYGDAADPVILKDAHIENASHLFIAISDTSRVLKIIEAVRHLNPAITIVTEIQLIAEKKQMDELNVEYICREEEALKPYAALAEQILSPT